MGGGKTETQYEVKWKGWDKKHNTYEPLSNLAGCEDMVSEYKERKRQRDAELGGADGDLLGSVRSVRVGITGINRQLPAKRVTAC